MRKIVLLFVAALFLSGLFIQTEMINQPKLIGCWVDSGEEYQANSDVKIFRPCDFKVFPPSRYRYKLELKAHSLCSWLYLAPNDAHYMVNGTWTYDDNTKVLKIFDGSVTNVKQFTVIEVGKDVLKMKVQ